MCQARGAAHVAQAWRQGGSIVNVSSAASRLGAPGEYVDYAASKGALDSFTIGLSKEVAGEGIRVNAVRPGYIFTDFHALSGDPDRVSKLESGIPWPWRAPG
ncbi:oxidoreductase [Pseudomonas fluorescens]|uniref:Oxidoreductase n=1 Tax=Pseudomonas fluorescens TaxID=294 RepID=A0A8B4I8R0_PSEFL|nr:oxidoreductase [Pseudomonas fluorescens]